MSGTVRLGAQRVADALMATHGTTLEGLSAALFGLREPGNLIMPSVAITRTDGILPRFGEVRLVLDPSTVQPGRNVRVFGEDAWTPRVSAQLADDFTLSAQFQHLQQNRIREMLLNLRQQQTGLPPQELQIIDNFLAQNARSTDPFEPRNYWGNSPADEAARNVYELIMRNFRENLTRTEFARTPQGQEYGRIIRGEMQPADSVYLPLQADGTPFSPNAFSYVLQRPFAEDLAFTQQNVGTRLGEVGGNITAGSYIIPGHIRAAFAPEYTGANFADALRGNLQGQGTANRQLFGDALTDYFRQFPGVGSEFEDIVARGADPAALTRQEQVAARNAIDFPARLEARTLDAAAREGGGARGELRRALAAEQNAVGRYGEAKIEDLLPLNPNTIRAILASPNNTNAVQARQLFRERGFDVPITRDIDRLRPWLFGAGGIGAALGAGTAQAGDLPPEVVQAALAGVPRGNAEIWSPQATQQAEAQAGQAAGFEAIARRMGGRRAQPGEAGRMAAEQSAETRRDAENFPGGLAGLGAWRVGDLATPIPMISRLLGYNPDPGDDTPFWADALGAGLWAAPGAYGLARQALRRGNPPNNVRNMVNERAPEQSLPANSVPPAALEDTFLPSPALVNSWVDLPPNAFSFNDFGRFEYPTDVTRAATAAGRTSTPIDRYTEDLVAQIGSLPSQYAPADAMAGIRRAASEPRFEIPPEGIRSGNDIAALARRMVGGAELTGPTDRAFGRLYSADPASIDVQGLLGEGIPFAQIFGGHQGNMVDRIPASIQLNPQALRSTNAIQQVPQTLAHEIGHAIDYLGLPRDYLHQLSQRERGEIIRQALVDPRWNDYGHHFIHGQGPLMSQPIGQYRPPQAVNLDFYNLINRSVVAPRDNYPITASRWFEYATRPNEIVAEALAHQLLTRMPGSGENMLLEALDSPAMRARVTAR